MTARGLRRKGLLTLMTTPSPVPAVLEEGGGWRQREEPGAEAGGGGRGASGKISSCPTYMAGPGENTPRACLSCPLLRYLEECATERETIRRLITNRIVRLGVRNSRYKEREASAFLGWN